jgi:hypothetical protein
MMLITASIASLRKRTDLFSRAIINASRTPFPAIAVDHGFHSLLSIARFEPIDVSWRTLEHRCYLPDAQLSTKVLIKYVDSFLFLRVQCHCFVHTDIITELFTPDNITDP